MERGLPFLTEIGDRSCKLAAAGVLHESHVSEVDSDGVVLIWFANSASTLFAPLLPPPASHSLSLSLSLSLAAVAATVAVIAEIGVAIAEPVPILVPETLAAAFCT